MVRSSLCSILIRTGLQRKCWKLPGNLRQGYLAFLLQSWTKVLGQIDICGAFSHAPNKFIYTCSAPPPPPHHPPPYNVVHAISPEFQHCIGAGRGGGGRILKRITVLFENSVLKTPKISTITQVSQGILSTIVWFSRLIIKCTVTMFFSLKCI